MHVCVVIMLKMPCAAAAAAAASTTPVAPCLSWKALEGLNKPLNVFFFKASTVRQSVRV